MRLPWSKQSTIEPESAERTEDDRAENLARWQIVECAPWRIPVEALDTEPVRKAAANLRNRVRFPQSESSAEQQSIFSES
jgi:hypothetical protein